MSIADNLKAIMSKSSLIREMFEKGARLKQQHGPENVYDFSIGNPNLPPPAAFLEGLTKVAAIHDQGVHGYMPNTGYLETRQAVADFVNRDQGVELCPDDIIMTCGAAGGLNVIFRSLLNPGEEVIVPSPYFVEYDFYAANANAVLKKAPAKADFSLSISGIESALNPKTKIVLINSPNNPTGQVYSAESLKRLGNLLEKASREFNKTIYLVSDEPYRRIAYQGVEVPSIFSFYKDSIFTTSFSKDLSIPGERIGYIATNPDLTYRQDVLNAMALSNRTLGFVNAPALMQRVLPLCLNASVDMQAYTRKRDLLCQGLSSCGYEFLPPAGTFYVFAKSPIKDDLAFVEALQEERIIAVPGSAFGCPGFFRLAFCVKDDTITRSIPGFRTACQRVA
ncbi:MAG: pyridoxal phosphate-dependent aminotransferase [Desulfobacteraceae bacterium]|nr:pyridoxal phosphate-dependent aminotransferase [Desulfobacteraceae bacterium]